MTGHYEKKFFSVKSVLDLGVIKVKFVSFSKKLATVPSGFDRTAGVFFVR